MAGQNHFLPGPSALFTPAFYSYFNANEEYERRFHPNSYYSYPGSGYWQQSEKMATARKSFSIPSAQATIQTQAEQNLPKVKNCCGAESQEHAAWRKIWGEFNYRIKSSNKILNWEIGLETYISICSNILVPTHDVSRIRPLAKFLRIFFLAKNWKYLNSRGCDPEILLWYNLKIIKFLIFRLKSSVEKFRVEIWIAEWHDKLNFFCLCMIKHCQNWRVSLTSSFVKKLKDTSIKLLILGLF